MKDYMTKLNIHTIPGMFRYNGTAQQTLATKFMNNSEEALKVVKACHKLFPCTTDLETAAIDYAQPEQIAELAVEELEKGGQTIFQRPLSLSRLARALSHTDGGRAKVKDTLLGREFASELAFYCTNGDRLSEVYDIMGLGGTHNARRFLRDLIMQPTEAQIKSGRIRPYDKHSRLIDYGHLDLQATTTVLSAFRRLGDSSTLEISKEIGLVIQHMTTLNHDTPRIDKATLYGLLDTEEEGSEDLDVIQIVEAQLQSIKNITERLWADMIGTTLFLFPTDILPTARDTQHFLSAQGDALIKQVDALVSLGSIGPILFYLQYDDILYLDTTMMLDTHKHRLGRVHQTVEAMLGAFRRGLASYHGAGIKADRLVVFGHNMDVHTERTRLIECLDAHFDYTHLYLVSILRDVAIPKKQENRAFLGTYEGALLPSLIKVHEDKVKYE